METTEASVAAVDEKLLRIGQLARERPDLRDQLGEGLDRLAAAALCETTGPAVLAGVARPILIGALIAVSSICAQADGS